MIPWLQDMVKKCQNHSSSKPPFCFISSLGTTAHHGAGISQSVENESRTSHRTTSPPLSKCYCGREAETPEPCHRSWSCAKRLWCCWYWCHQYGQQLPGSSQLHSHPELLSSQPPPPTCLCFVIRKLSPVLQQNSLDSVNKSSDSAVTKSHLLSLLSSPPCFWAPVFLGRMWCGMVWCWHKDSVPFAVCSHWNRDMQPWLSELIIRATVQARAGQK